MNQMGNLEKLGILVIVILVVVVGVVAITPKDRVDEALYPEMADAPQPLDADRGTAADAPSPGDPKSWPLGTDAGTRMSDVAAENGGAGAAPGTTPGTTLPPAGTPGTSQATAPAATPPAPAQPAFREYTVRSGDSSLTLIAKREMGRASAVSEILAANPGLDPRRMQIGQKIKLPNAVPAAGAPTADTSASPATTIPGTTGPVAPTPPGGVVPSPMPPLPAPPTASAEKLYVVQPGDTLSDIARREMGSASKWRQLAEANTETLRGSEMVRPGMKLRIPARAAATASSAAPAAPTPAAPGNSAAKSYTVQSGDTLSSIASRLLGSSARWREIQRANENVLHGSDQLQVGMRLAIPDDVAAR